MELLPPEIKQHLAQFLDQKSKRIMRVANYQWFNAINLGHYVIYFLKWESMREIADRLSKYAWPIHLTFKKSLTAILPSMSYDLSKLTNLESLEIDWNYYQWNQLRAEEESNQYEWQPLLLLTNLKRLSIDDEVSKRLRSLIPQISNLTSLEIALGGYSRAVCDEKDFYGMTNLLELSLTLTNDCSMPLTYCPTNLTKLYLLYAPDDWSDCMDVELGDYKQLKALELVFNRAMINGIRLLDLPTSLQSFKLEAKSITNSIRSLHDCTNLTQLYLMSYRDIDTSIIADQVASKLRIFGMSKIKPSPDTSRLLSSLPQGLERIDIKGVDISSIIHLASSVRWMSIQSTSDLTLISHFSNLTYLKIDRSERYSGTLEEVQQLTNLKSLIVKLKCPVDPSALTNLDHLSLNSAIDIDRYLTLTNLTSLHCTMDTINSNFRNLTLLTRLVQLKLKTRFDDQYKIPGKFWRRIGRLTTLTDLVVKGVKKYGPPITDILLLRDLTKLTRLSTPVSYTKEEFYLFTQLSNMQMLYLFSMNELYMPDSLEELQNNMPYLRHVQSIYQS